MRRADHKESSTSSSTSDRAWGALTDANTQPVGPGVAGVASGTAGA